MEREKDLGRYETMAREHTYGVYAADANPSVRKESGVLVQLAALDETIGRLHELTDTLVLRLRPVLDTSDEKQPPAKLSGPPVTQEGSQVGAQLEIAVERLRQLHRRLSDAGSCLRL